MGSVISFRLLLCGDLVRLSVAEGVAGVQRDLQRELQQVRPALRLEFLNAFQPACGRLCCLHCFRAASLMGEHYACDR